MISLPVASPRAWTMRSRPWPPSRARARRPPLAVELRAPLDQFGDPRRALARPPARPPPDRTAIRRPRACRPRAARSCRPGRARRRCRPGRSVLFDCSTPCLAITTTESRGSTASAARSPASPPPTTSTSVKKCGTRLGWNGTRSRGTGLDIMVFGGCRHGGPAPQFTKRRTPSPAGALDPASANPRYSTVTVQRFAPAAGQRNLLDDRRLLAGADRDAGSRPRSRESRRAVGAGFDLRAWSTTCP